MGKKLYILRFDLCCVVLCCVALSLSECLSCHVHVCLLGLVVECVASVMKWMYMYFNLVEYLNYLPVQ